MRSVGKVLVNVGTDALEGGLAIIPLDFVIMLFNGNRLTRGPLELLPIRGSGQHWLSGILSGILPINKVACSLPA